MYDLVRKTNPPNFEPIFDEELLTIVDYLSKDPNLIKPFQSRLKDAQNEDLMNRLGIIFDSQFSPPSNTNRPPKGRGYRYI
jgi:hypothetical protein